MKKKLIALLTITIIFSSSLNLFATEPVQNEVEVPQQRQMILQLDHTLGWINGEELILQARPKVIDGRTYLPLRFMGDKLLEASVNWDAHSKKVTIMKDGRKVEVTIGSNQGYINGEQVKLQNTPIIVDSNTYLPLRTTAEIFDIQADYDEASRQVILTTLQGGASKPSIVKPEVIKPPVAQFYFESDNYVAGQPVKAIDTSSHENRAITNRLWMIDFDESKTNESLAHMFNKPNAGKYLVSLKVEAGKDNWSDWTTKEITIQPNQKPVITKLVPDKNRYAGGELMDFTYTYDNEPWEDIKATRWTYRKAGEALSQAVVQKPDYIFQAGNYIVTLQLQDDFGNWSDVKEGTVVISPESRQSELEYRFTKGVSGDIIDNFNHFNYLNYDAVEPDEAFLEGGKLILSNSPENVRATGILYKDTVQGEGRILLHHHNSFTQAENLADPKKMVLVAENPTNEPVILTISNKVKKGPSSDILFVGAQLLYEYLQGTDEKTYYLNPGEKRYIYDSGDRRWGTGQLLSTQMDFNVTGSVTFTAAAISKTTQMAQIAALPALGKDVHPRGTFEGADIHYKVTADHTKPTRLSLGSGVREWVNGYDAITGEATQNRGNYAVDYKIDITAVEDTGVLLNPRAGLFRGALRWDGEDVFLAPNKGYIIGSNSKGIMLGVVKAGETRTLEYTLPNGSAAPVLLVFMPEDSWTH